jgi:small subunit ribosomal protein S19
MIRSIWKPPLADVAVFQAMFSNNKNLAIVLFYDSLIFPSFVKNTFLVYNGKRFVNLLILEHMVGFKFSRFIKN